MARRTDAVWRCRCGAKNDVPSSRCEDCGLDSPAALSPSETTPDEDRPARDLLGYFNAAKIYRLVAKGELGWGEARAQLQEFFGDEVVRRAIVDQPRRLC